MRAFVLSFFVFTALAFTAHARLGSQIYGSGIPNSLREILKPVLTTDECSIDNVMNHHLAYPLMYYIHNHGKVAVPMAHHTHSFFLEEDLYTGSKLKITLQPAGVLPECAYPPRSIADAIPFSSDHLNDILNQFSVAPNTADATLIKDTLAICELPPMPGEGKMCATSLEVMEEFVKWAIGRNAKAGTTTVEEDPTGSKTYTVGKVENISGKKQMSCHRLSYPYALHYCHELPNTIVYRMEVVREDGVAGEALAMCHRDTSEWRADFSGFSSLNVKPGDGAVCHFLRKGHLLYVAPEEKLADIEQVV